MTAFWGEVIGTAMMFYLGGGVCASTSLKKSFGHNAGWLAIQFAWGIAVVAAIFAVGNYSGAHLNPAITITFAIIGDFAWGQVPAYITAQFIGAMAGAAAVFLHYLPHWQATDDPAVKLGVFATGPAISHRFSNLLSEMLATFFLVLALLAIGANKFSDGLNPFIIGLLIMTIGLSLGGTTGTAMNPARDLGPRIMHFLLPIPGKGGSNWGYAWIPAAGPIIGGSLGGLFYKAAFHGEMIGPFWTALTAAIVMLLIVYFSSRHKTSLQDQLKNRAA